MTPYEVAVANVLRAARLSAAYHLRRNLAYGHAEALIDAVALLDACEAQEALRGSDPADRVGGDCRREG